MYVRGVAVYRVRAEVRRDCSASPWELGGFVIAGEWHPAATGIERPSAQLAAGRNVQVVDLPAFIAPDDATAIAVGCAEAGRAGYGTLAAVGPPRGEFRITMPELEELDGEG